MHSRIVFSISLLSLALVLLGGIVVRHHCTASSAEYTRLQQTVDAQHAALLSLHQQFRQLSNLLSVVAAVPFDEKDADFYPESTIALDYSVNPDMELLHSTLADVCESLFRLEYIVDSAGLESFADSANSLPVSRSAATAAVSRVQSRISIQIETDRELYGDEIVDLYNQARARWKPGADNSAREEAFTTLTEQYPDSHLAAMALAERAIAAGVNGNPKAVAELYVRLADSKAGASLVTERGIEPLPALEYYLARWHISNKRYAAAQPLIDSLKNNYTGGKIFNITADKRWYSGRKVLKKLVNMKHRKSAEKSQ